jgi:hypothetical protein
MATQIGEIKVIIGKVGLITPDGTPQPLKVGAKVFTDQIITTGPTSAVEIEFIDGSTMALPQNSQAVLDSETFDPLQSRQETDVADLQDAVAGVADLQDAVADVADLQDAVADVADLQGAVADVADLQGAVADVADLQDALADVADPTEEAEATAANAGSLPVGNEGASTEQVLHEQPIVTPESGFETTGPARGGVVLEAETLNDALMATADLAIYGGAGDDTIIGGAGDDTIIGGAGDDMLIGGAGDDMLTGGVGADTFIWTKADVGAGSATRDTVVDFNPADDKDILDLSDLLSDSSHTIDGLAVDNLSGGGQHFQLSIKNNGGVVVQTIDLGNMVISPGQDPSAMLNNLLNSGAINDGI